MQALIVDTGRKIAPFMEAPGEMWFALGTVGEVVRSQLEKRGIHLVTDAESVTEDCVVLADHVFLSDLCLGGFLERAFGDPDERRLGLCHTAVTEYVRPVSSIVIEPLEAPPPKAQKADAAATEQALFDVFWVPKGKLPTSDVLSRLRASSKALLVGKREIVRDVRMPTLGDEAQRNLRYPISATVAVHVEHWVHVLWLNHLAFGVLWGEIARQHRAWVAWRAMTTWPPSMAGALKSMVRKGKNVQIHPTADVEGSVLGDDVVIGARASVRNSVVGHGAEIGDNATIIASTVGDRAFITPRTFFVWSTAFPDAVISNYKLQMCVAGRGSATSTWAGFIDAKFTGAIDVFLDGEKRSTERSFLGSCLGHRAFLGAKALVLPGREIPNDTFIAMRPDELITTIPDDLPPGEPVVRHEGTLVPVRSLS